jgi:hypothetical protein
MLHNPNKIVLLLHLKLHSKGCEGGKKGIRERKTHAAEYGCELIMHARHFMMITRNTQKKGAANKSHKDVIHVEQDPVMVLWNAVAITVR